MFVKTPETSRRPLKLSSTVSVPATGSAEATINLGSLSFIKSVTVTKGTNTTINDIKIDNEDTFQVATFDTVNIFGSALTGQASVTVSGSNAGVAAENLTVEIVGYQV
jgi:hypothetical protein